ncbi:MAG: hypothetical protein ACLS6O_05310 [Bifidobacterium sp.]
MSAATASVGQTVTYTITSKVPQNTQYYSDYAYTYTDTRLLARLCISIPLSDGWR